MSYILDALRRADAERERGQVPGLNSRGTAPVPSAAPVSALRSGLIGLGAGGVLAIAAFWVWRSNSDHDTTRSAAPAMRASAASGLTPAPTPTAVAIDTTPLPALAADASPVVTPVSPPAPAPTAAATPGAMTALSSTLRATPPSRPDKASTAAAAIDSTRPRQAVAFAESTRRTTVAGLSGPTPTAAASAVPERVVRPDELPDDVRRQLPALGFGGSAFSANPASRFVIVNGQLFHEGDSLAPGLTLEQIRLKSAVLAFKGYRYGVNF